MDIMYNNLFIFILVFLMQCSRYRSIKQPYVVINTVKYNTLQEEFEHDFAFLYKEIRNNYVNLAYKEKRYNFKWDKLYDKYKQKISDIKTYKEFYKICTEFTAYLHDGHLRFLWVPSKKKRRILEDDYLIRKAISLCLIENKGIVSQAVKEVIIDVRGNGGGNESSREILGFLTAKKIIINRYRFKDTERFRQLHGKKRILFENLRSPSFREHLDEGYTKWWGWVLKPQKEDYLRTVPVIVIYDNHIFSDAIGFVKTCKQFNLATIMGPSMELTNNGFTSPVLLPGGNFSIKYSAMEFRKPDYTYEEYLKPDIELHIKLDDVYQGKDTLLEAAISFLNKKVKPGSY